MKLDRTVLILGSFLTIVVMLWFIVQIGKSREEGRLSRSDSNTSTGVKVFSDLIENLRPNSATSWRRPFLNLEDLDHFDTIFLVAPRIPLSSREEDILVEWIAEGGHLVVTAEDEEGLDRIRSILHEASFTKLIDETPGFKQGVATSYEPKNDSSYLKKGESYEAYSPLRFQDSICLADEGTCWSRESELDDGKVTLFLGIPPFANAMISRADNKRLAARLALESKRVAFDEYHLLVNEKTTSDLLFDPAFALPMLGMLLGILLYFVAGGEEEVSMLASPARKKRPSSWREFGRRVVQRTLERPGVLREAVLRHGKFFAGLAPKEREEIDEIVRPLTSGPTDDGLAAKVGLQLALHHQTWLKNKGRR